MKIIKARLNSGIVPRILDKSGAGIVETLIVLIVLSVLVVVAIDRYDRVSMEAKKAALRTELGNLREAIVLFHITKGRYPESLKELITENIVVPYRDVVVNAQYLEPYSIDKNMNILDPFGEPFLYNPKNGKVCSQKKGFEMW